MKINIKTEILPLIQLDKTKVISGKKEGIGGIAELERRVTPNKIGITLNFILSPKKNPRRELVD